MSNGAVMEHFFITVFFNQHRFAKPETHLLIRTTNPKR